MWKIEKIVSKGDYNYAIVRDHPFRTKNDYVLEHRIVMENHLGRILNPNEVVHHINNDKKDNKIENLELMIANDHVAMHSRKGKKYVKLKCPNCKNIFDIAKGQSFLQKGTKCTFCSRHCCGVFNANIQHHGITVEMENAISENLVLEYIYFNDNSEEIN